MICSRTPREFFSADGVQIKETDVGQPCTECSKCMGYEPHNWRKNCRNCKCLREGHEIVAEHGARSRLGLTSNHDGLDARSLGYTFVPAGLTTARQVDQYYSSLPTHEVPKLGSKGEAARLQRIVKQLPKQDLALAACKFVEDSVKSSYQDFISARNEIALDIGLAKPAPPNSICDGCNRTIPNQQVSVVAPRMGKLIWHPGCFRCSTCQDLLVDLAYCVYDEKIYCERHYAELLKPRCEGCDEAWGSNCTETECFSAPTTAVLAPGGPRRDIVCLLTLLLPVALCLPMSRSTDENCAREDAAAQIVYFGP
ncbi:Protein espinas-like Protein [Tribolium castaneum]|uniref:Protein espinas-like Protein n=1 Tax=Tribolium castaneum TaxID=7070 RepID=D6WJL7_TRICA|nr:Protein espinas-like Protein [Tribolium castaneum]